MATLDECLKANVQYAATFKGGASPPLGALLRRNTLAARRNLEHRA